MSAVLRAAIRRYALLMLLCTVVGGLLGAGASQLVEKTYTSSSSTIVRPAAGNSLSPSTAAGTINQVTIAMETEVSLVTTPGVAALASKDAGTTLPAPADKVRAQVPPSTQIIEITYTSPSQSRAQQGAEAYAEAFLAFRADNAKRATDAQVASLTKQLDTANDNLKEASAQAANQTDPRSYSAQQLQLYAERVANLTNSISSAQAASQDPGEVIRQSQTAARSNGLPSSLFVIIGALLGAAFGIGISVARVARDDRIRTGDKVSMDGLPVLASNAGRSMLEPLVPEASALDADLEEALREIRTTVLADLQPGSVIAVSSVSPHLATSAFGFNLATSFARAGFTSTLLDVDINSASASGLPVSLDLDRSEVEVYSGSERFDADDLASPRFRSLVETLRRSDGYLVLAVSPVGTSSGDAAAGASDAVILLATEQRTTKNSLRTARIRLLSLGTVAIGVVSLTSQRASASRRQGRGQSSAERQAPAHEALEGGHGDHQLPSAPKTSSPAGGSERPTTSERALHE